MADDLRTQFEAAAQDAKALPRRPDDQTLLQLYALYKQATAGDVQGKRPGMLAMVERAKYDAWAKLHGTSTESAMQSYVALVTKVQGK
jgi:acyl-CoA-binding protein